MEFRPLPPLLQEKVQKECNEEPLRVASDILYLREWLAKQPHLKLINPSDQFLVAFLRGNKYSLEKTKSKLDIYYTLRTVCPDIYQNRNPFNPDIQDILKMGIFLPLKTSASEDSSRICIQRLGPFDSSNHSFVDLLKVVLMIIDIMIQEDDNFIISGENLIVDLKGVGINTFSQWTPAIAKKSMTILEKALPLRMKSSHIINTSTGFEAAYSIFKIFFSEKLKRRFKVCSQNFDDMYEVNPQKILPKEYGGEEGTVQQLTDYWKSKVESYSEWYLQEEKVCSIEALRPGQPKTTSDLFGLEGSFRKLEVD